VVVAPLPRRRAHTLRVGGLWKHSSSFSLSLQVGLFISLEASLTCVLHYLELILSHAMRSVWLGMPPGTFLYIRANRSLDRSHHFRPIEVGLYFIGIHQGYVSCVFLRDPGEYISL